MNKSLDSTDLVPLNNGLCTMFQSYNDVVTVPELAKMLRIGRNTAYDLISNGQIQSVRIKNQIRIPKDKIIEFLKGKARRLNRPALLLCVIVSPCSPLYSHVYCLASEHISVK